MVVVVFGRLSTKTVRLQSLVKKHTTLRNTTAKINVRASHRSFQCCSAAQLLQGCIRDWAPPRTCDANRLPLPRLGSHRPLKQKNTWAQSVSIHKAASVLHGPNQLVRSCSEPFMRLAGCIPSFCGQLASVRAVFQECGSTIPCGHCPNMFTCITTNHEFDFADHFPTAQTNNLCSSLPQSRHSRIHNAGNRHQVVRVCLVICPSS